VGGKYHLSQDVCKVTKVIFCKECFDCLDDDDDVCACLLNVPVDLGSA